MIKTFALSVALCFLFSGCSSLKIDSRLVCSMDRTKAYVVGDVSMFSAVLPISDTDATAVCGSQTKSK